MSALCKLTVIAFFGALALGHAESGYADLPPAMAQVLNAKREFDGWWAIKTTPSALPVDSQELPPELPGLDGNTMLGRVVLIYENRNGGGTLSGSYHNMPDPAEPKNEDDEEVEKAGAVSGVVRNRALAASDETPADPSDPAAVAAAAAAALKKLERDVVMIVIVDIPDEDEDIVLRYRGTQLKTEMKGTVELGKRNKDGNFEKAGDGTFIARKLN